jgi:putative flippase GtrA
VSTAASLIKYRSPALRFLLVGVGNTVLGLLVIYALKWVVGWNDVPANAMGYAIGITFSFIINKRWTFRHEGAVVQSFARFLLICAIGYLANLAVLVLVVHSLGWNGYVAQLIAMGAYTLFSYCGSRYYAFGGARNRLSPANNRDEGGPT